MTEAFASLAALAAAVVVLVGAAAVISTFAPWG
jgi:hypothetical protein